jgi:2-dehydro-3-deoxy-D-arabinonate dehydratase
MALLQRLTDRWILKVENSHHELNPRLVEAYFMGMARAEDLIVSCERRFEFLESHRLLAPLLNQEVWGAGVTYARSQAARVNESEGSASLYDKVYAAERPHLFFKGLAWKAGGHEDYVGYRADSTWSVPEPELALVISPAGKVIGLTVGNDATARDIEASNPLYLSQVKIYEHSACFGPGVLIFDKEPDWRAWKMEMEIERGGARVFAGEVSLSQLKRTWEELVSWLYRFQEFPDGAVLLTGTGIIPPDSYRMEDGDVITIRCSGIGTMVNVARRIEAKK